MDIQATRRMNLRAQKDPALKEREFAEKCGLGESYLSQIMNEHRPFGEKTARKVEKNLGLRRFALDVGPGQHAFSEADGGYENTSRIGIRGWIPLISYVQAGEWGEAIDIYEPGFSEKVSPTTVPHSNKTFALQVEGDSMTLPSGVQGRSFPPGMIIYIDPERESMPGDYVVAKHNGNSRVTFKRLMIEEGRPILVPLNPDRGTHPVIRDEFEVIGRVIDASWGGF